MTRHNQLNIKLTEKELEYLRLYAKSQYSSISSVVRNLIFLGIERAKNEKTDDNLFR
jgi:c-di-GMP-related signal transduction protein